MAVMRSQPQGLALLNRSYLGRCVGAIFTATSKEIGGSGAEVALYGNPAATVVPGHGLARKLIAASSQYATIAPPADLIDFSLETPFAIVFAFTAASLGTTARLYSYRHAANNTGVQLVLGGASSRLGFCLGNSSGQAPQVNSREAIEAGKPYVVVCGWDGSAYFLYVNGSKQAGSSIGTIVTTNPSIGTEIYIGRRNTGTSYLDGSVSLFAHIKGQVDALSLSLNPWQIFDEQGSEDEMYAALAAVETPPMALVGAPSTQGSTSGSGAIIQRHALAGASSMQGASSPGAAVVQAHALMGAATTQGSTSPGAAIIQGHALAGAPSWQGSSSGTGTISEEHVAAGAPSFQSSTSPGGAITQAHQLAGAPTTQASTSPGGALETLRPADESVGVGAPTDQPSWSSGGGIVQAHVLAGAATTQGSTSPGAAARQTHVLAGAPSWQSSSSGAGAMVEQHVAMGAPSFQSSTSGKGAILQWHRLQGAGTTQGSTSPGGAMSQTIGGVPQAVIGIRITPSAVDLDGLNTVMFEADVEVTGGVSQAVVWSALYGKIQPDGFYTAPRAIGRDQFDVITARSAADKSKSVSVTVRIKAGLFNSWGVRERTKQELETMIWPELSDPTEAQAASGNYRKDRFSLYGLRIAIENPANSVRYWRDKNGTKGSQTMTFAYGYLVGTLGNDGDELDCTIGPAPLTSEVAYVVNQFIDGKFDEHKIMLGFASQSEAEAGYLSNYERGWKGLHSCQPCSITQLKWWIANSNKSRPLTNDLLPYEGNAMNKVLWDSADKPRNLTLDQVLYAIRGSDAADGLLFDAVSMADVLGDADAVLTLDALVVPFSRIEQRMGIMRKVLDRTGKAVKVAAMQVSDPFTQRGTTNVAVIYELTDGQTVSVFFHNPDVTPKKILPGDDLVSWKWMLNKKDITIAVAPEKGRDLEPRIVAARIMLLAEKNSERFAKANTKRAERMDTIASLQTELDTKKATLADLEQQVAAAEAAAGTRDPEPQPSPQPDPQPDPDPQPEPQPDPQPAPAADPESETYREYLIYPTRVGGNIMFAVQSDENKALAAAGERTIGGDTLHATIEQARAEVDRLIIKAEADAKSNAEWEARRAEEEAKAAAIRAEFEDVDGFADGLSPMQKEKVLQALNTVVRYKGEVVTRKAIVRAKVAEGWSMGADKEMGRVLEQADAVLGTKQLTKTGLDYAAYLISKRPAPEPLDLDEATTTTDDEEAADGDFLALAAEGKVDFYDKAVTDRLAALARKYTDPEGAYLDMIERAKTAAKNWFIAEFKKRVG